MPLSARMMWVVPTLMHRFGGMETFDAEKVDDLISELDLVEDPEHPDVAVSDDDGWTLTAFPTGLVVWENVESEDDSSRHARGVSREAIRELFTRLGTGDRSAVERLLDWQPG